MILIKVIGAFLAIFSFAIVLETPKKYLVYAGIVGAVGWLVYLLALEGGANDVFATFLSAAAIALVSHIFARVFKTPVTVFLVAGILPTVPGAGMYRIVYYFIQNDTAMASYYLTITLELAGAIAIALFLVDAVFRAFQKGWKQNSLRYQEKNVDKSSKIV
ncbi:MAG: threonine/serine exporter family protein [Tyzzerella sp.]|nr:threonine/serine exporter family protein [Tyzzerella sp.]